MHVTQTFLIFLVLCATRAGAALSTEMAKIVAAPVEILQKMDFDSQTPGEAPHGWGCSGTPARGNVLQVISNVEAVSHPCALLLDNSKLGATESPGYYTTDIPSVSNGIAVVSFCFRLEEGQVTAEIRITGKKFWISHVVTIQDNLVVKGFIYDTGSGILSRINRYVWYRVTLWLPTKGANIHCWCARLDMRAGDGVWTLGEPMEFQSDKLDIDGAYTGFDFCGDGPSKMFVDDVTMGVIKEVE